jgi:hypothetical protein
VTLGIFSKVQKSDVTLGILKVQKSDVTLGILDVTLGILGILYEESTVAEVNCVE